MPISRREFLRLGLIAGIGVALPFSASACSGEGSTGTLLPSRVKLPEPFGVPLPLPPVLEPVRTDAGAGYYEITQKVGRMEILPGLETEVWGYEGMFPGPTIESRSGRKIVVRQTNELPVPVSTHLHGGRTPPESDGYPTDLIMPKGMAHDHSMHGHGSMGVGGSRHSKDYVYPQEQRAATLWYHDHRMDFTGPQVWRGLAGLHIIRDDEEDALPLPKGEKDVPLMICDRSFDEDGSFLYPSLDSSLRDNPGVEDAYMDGVLGDTILVNGAPWPVLEVSNTKYRFRILNASNARRYELALESGNTPFIQIGSDGGLLGAPVVHRTIRIAQAERFDVVVDFSKYNVGDEITLKNRIGEGETANVMRFRVTRKERDDATVLRRLSDHDGVRRAGRIQRPSHARVPLHPGCRRGQDDVGHQRRAVRSWAYGRQAGVRVHRSLAPESGPCGAPDPPSPRTLQGALPQRQEAFAHRRRLERHRGPDLGRGGARARPFRRLPGPLRLPLPQLRARGHDDDGQLRGRVRLQATGFRLQGFAV